MKARELKILRELLHKPRFPRAVKKAHGDIEDAIEAAGGKRGGLSA